MPPLPWIFAVLQYLGINLTLIDSLSCNLQDKVNIVGYGTAGGPWRHPKWPPKWPPSWISLKVQTYRETRKLKISSVRVVKYDTNKHYATFGSVL